MKTYEIVRTRDNTVVGTVTAEDYASNNKKLDPQMMFIMDGLALVAWMPGTMPYYVVREKS